MFYSSHSQHYVVFTDSELKNRGEKGGKTRNNDASANSYIFGYQTSFLMWAITHFLCVLNL